MDGQTNDYFKQLAQGGTQSTNNQDNQITSQSYFEQLTGKPLPNSQSQTKNPSQSYFEKLTGKPLPSLGSYLDDRILARATEKTGDQTYNNLCERFVEDSAYGKHGLYPSAIDAWNNYMQTDKQKGGNVFEAPKGALIYFAGDKSNDGYGHAGIADGQGNFVSATSGGVKTVPIDAWIQATSQKPLGYVIP